MLTTSLSAKYGVKRIGLFGSYVKGEPSITSDIDLVIEFNSPMGLKFIKLAEYLERLLGQKVDLLTIAGLQAIRISGIEKEIAKSIVYV